MSMVIGQAQTVDPFKQAAEEFDKVAEATPPQPPAPPAPPSDAISLQTLREMINEINAQNAMNQPAPTPAPPATYEPPKIKLSYVLSAEEIADRTADAPVLQKMIDAVVATSAKEAYSQIASLENKINQLNAALSRMNVNIFNQNGGDVLSTPEGQRFMSENDPLSGIPRYQMVQALGSNPNAAHTLALNYAKAFKEKNKTTTNSPPPATMTVVPKTTGSGAGNSSNTDGKNSVEIAKLQVEASALRKRLQSSGLNSQDAEKLRNLNEQIARLSF